MLQPIIFLQRRKAFFLFCLLTVCLLPACKKDVAEISDAGNASVIKRPDVARVGGIIIQNNSASPVRLTMNGIAIEKFIAPRSMDTLYGSPLSPAKVLVETVVTDADGNPAGQQLVFFYSLNFPAQKEYLLKPVNIPSNLFFLKVHNPAKLPANGVVVSEPGTNNIVASLMGVVDSNNDIPCGYYPTTTLVANIKLINSNSNAQQWNFTGVQLPGVPNQSITITCQ